MVVQEPREEVRGRVINVSSQFGFTSSTGEGRLRGHQGRRRSPDAPAGDRLPARGIVVNAVAPGRIVTGTHPGELAYLNDGVVDTETASPSAARPLSGLGRPEDVAGAALFLASDDCSFISGQTLHVDGGWTAY